MSPPSPPPPLILGTPRDMATVLLNKEFKERRKEEYVRVFPFTCAVAMELRSGKTTSRQSRQKAAWIDLLHGVLCLCMSMCLCVCFVTH